VAAAFCAADTVASFASTVFAAITPAAAVAFAATSAANCSVVSLTVEAASDADSTPWLNFSVTNSAAVAKPCFVASSASLPLA